MRAETVSRSWTLRVASLLLIGVLLPQARPASAGICDGFGGDADLDGVCGNVDNCPDTPNPDQLNGDNLPPGDACQCGDVDTDNDVDILDVVLTQRHAAGARNPAGFDVRRCSVFGGTECDGDDVDRLRLHLTGVPDVLEQDCTAAQPLCGNDFLDPGEICDDGNLVDGDGCDSNCTPTACGNGIQTAPEECDDGNQVDGDGCDSNCTPTGCGNGIRTGDEECDDGNLADGDGCDSNCLEEGDPPSQDQEKCVLELNKNFAKVAKAQGKAILSCIKQATKGKLNSDTLEDCLIADEKGKVAKAQAKTLKKAGPTGKCPESATPDFGATDPDTVNQAAVDKELALIHDIFGDDLDAVIAPAEDESKDLAKCQEATAKQAQKCQDAKLKAFNACKESAINGKKGDAVETAGQLEERCLEDPTTDRIPDTKGKIAKACPEKLTQTLDRKCEDISTGAAFPGLCAQSSDVAGCLEELIDCRACLAINAADDLARDCDDFDDGIPNLSCPPCGNGIPEVGEECDDGNDVDGDGCTTVCTLEFCGDGIVQIGLDEDCDPPGSPCPDSALCQPDCRCPLAAGEHVSDLEVDAYCLGSMSDGTPYPGADPNGWLGFDRDLAQLCEETILHIDCPPGPTPRGPSARCLSISGAGLNTAVAEPQISFPLIGPLNLSCETIDPVTGEAVCTCEFESLEPVELAGIGFICFTLGPEVIDCPTGLLDCDGGAPMGWDLVVDHDIGPTVNALDPVAFPIGFCGLLDPTDNNTECTRMCDAYCTDLGEGYTTLEANCEGFCQGGPRADQPCAFDVDCAPPDGGGNCAGKEGLDSQHTNTCNCQCLRQRTEPAPAGGLSCQVPVQINVEVAAPCFDGDILIGLSPQCIPLSTEMRTGEFRNANAQIGVTIRGDSFAGRAIDCDTLSSSVLTGLQMVGHIAFFDSNIGDLLVPLNIETR